MKVKVKPGKYILAVSGGVDSMVLLNLLAKQPKLELIVAHFNHGIRRDSAQDEDFVRLTAVRLGLPFEVGYGNLESGASEEAARKARYNFLERTRLAYKAKAIITAHHQDDMLETALINLMRGTGYRGMIAISDNPKVIRPLLKYPKKTIVGYAVSKGLIWREDKTNGDQTYFRNYLRRSLAAELTPKNRQQMINNIDKVAKINTELSARIAKLSHLINPKGVIYRDKFSLLPSDLGKELVVYWLRQKNVINFDRRIVNRINIALRTSDTNKTCPIIGNLRLEIGKRTARFTSAYKQMPAGLL